MPACPACATTALTELTDKSGIAFDCCGKCRGVWLDGGELSQLMGKPFPEALLSPKDGSRNCPRCSKTMQRGGFLNPTLVVDRCGYCSGLWLDAAELRVVRGLLGVGQATDAEKAAPAAKPVEPPAPMAKTYEAPPPLPDPAALTRYSQTPAAPSSDWQMHAGWWLAAGMGTALYGWKRYAEWKAIADAGVISGKDPVWIAVAGGAMALLGLGFLIAQPTDSADYYMTFFKAILAPRGYRRYHRRSRHSWYNSDTLI